MRAPIEICRRRTVSAILASGLVISLTALTGGMTPAFAEPGSGSGSGPTTTVVPAPAPAQRAEPTAEAPAEAPAKAPQVEAPQVEAPPVVQAPPAVEAPPVVQAPPVETQAPPAEAPSRAPSPALAPSREAPPEPSKTTTTAAPAPRETPTPTSSAPDVATTTAKSPTTSDRETSPAQTPPAPATSSGAPSPRLAPDAGTSQAPSGSETPASSEAPGRNGTPETPGQSSDPRSPESSPTSSEAESGPTSESTNGSTSESNESGTSSAPQSEQSAAQQRVIPKSEPQTLVAPAEDVEIAKTAAIVEQPAPVAAPKEEIDQMANLIDLKSFDRGSRDRDFPSPVLDAQRTGGWDRNVRQWRPDWVSYDDYHRPVLANPYRDPVRIVYVYQNAPRIAYIPPLARIVLDVAQYAAYSFTALVLSPVVAAANVANAVANVAVGNFFGGGYYPGPGLPPPPPPPIFQSYNNVPVQVAYQDATYQPFRVNSITDVGDDPQYGGRKVLLDGVTPAWGVWTQTPAGERQFQVQKTQQFPGLDAPGEGPLPGDYQLRLASDESSSGLSNRDVYLLTAAVVLGVLALGAVVLSVVLGRRRAHH